mgnify:CR=1 FL=1
MLIPMPEIVQMMLRSDVHQVCQSMTLVSVHLCDHRFVYDGTIDWQLLLNNTKNKTPIVLLYAQECEVVEKLFLSLANKRGINTKIVNITSPDMETELKPLIQKAITSVSVSCCHTQNQNHAAADGAESLLVISLSSSCQILDGCSLSLYRVIYKANIVLHRQGGQLV